MTPASRDPAFNWRPSSLGQRTRRTRAQQALTLSSARLRRALERALSQRTDLLITAESLPSSRSTEQLASAADSIGVLLRAALDMLRVADDHGAGGVR
jgi:hypothetical protein